MTTISLPERSCSQARSRQASRPCLRLSQTDCRLAVGLPNQHQPSPAPSRRPASTSPAAVAAAADAHPPTDTASAACIRRLVARESPLWSPSPSPSPLTPLPSEVRIPPAQVPTVRSIAGGRYDVRAAPPLTCCSAIRGFAAALRRKWRGALLLLLLLPLPLPLMLRATDEGVQPASALPALPSPPTHNLTTSMAGGACAPHATRMRRRPGNGGDGGAGHLFSFSRTCLPLPTTTALHCAAA